MTYIPTSAASAFMGALSHVGFGVCSPLPNAHINDLEVVFSDRGSRRDILSQSPILIENTANREHSDIGLALKRVSKTQMKGAQ